MAAPWSTGPGLITTVQATDILCLSHDNGDATFTSKRITAENYITGLLAYAELPELPGTLAAAQFPALTGPVTTTAGSLATTIAAAAVTNAMLAGSIAASKLVGTDIATVGTLTAGATGAGFTIALTTSTVTGTLPAGAFPALTGDVTTAGGALATTLVLSVVHAWTGQQYFAQATLTDAASITWNLNTQQTAKVTLGGNRTLANPSNMVAGGTYTLIVVQDRTGSRTLAYGNAYKWPGGTAPVLSTAAGSIDIITFLSDGSAMYGVIQKAFS